LNTIDIPEEWESLVPTIQRIRGTVMILGAPDTGKTTLTRFLIAELSKRGEPIAYIDGDMGQSILGPPTTQGMAVLGKGETDLEKTPLSGAYFVGSTSPRGHGCETLVGLKKLLEKSQVAGEAIAILDTTGYVTGEDGLELKYQKIDLLNPRHLVALQRDSEIEQILRTQQGREGMVIYRLSSPPIAHRRSPDERRRYRWRLFQEYFRHVRLHSLDLKRISLTGAHRIRIDERHQGELVGLLLGLNGPDNLLVSLGIVEDLNRMKGILSCLIPASTDLERIRSVRLGSIRIDLSEETNGERFLGCN
jgi:polynucleotide 5'-hydroxyl-kinase GRC3/NOL9